MAIPIARVHLAVAHAALPALLPTPPKWKMLPLLPTPCVAAILPTKPLAKTSRGDSDERWDARKSRPASTESSASSDPHSANSVRSGAGLIIGSSRKTAASPPKPGRANSAERWDAHKKATSPASSSSSSGTSSLASSSKWRISRASSSEHWDMHKKRSPPQAELLDDGVSSSTGSNDSDTEEEEEEEILYMEAAGHVRWTGLHRRRARTQHASHANSVLGSRCLAPHSIDLLRTQAAGFFSYVPKQV